MTEIDLKIDIMELRSIYFENGNQKIFFGPQTKKQFIYMSIGLVLYPFYAFWALNLDDNILFLLGTGFVSLLIYDFVRVAKPVYQWKKSVESFLKGCENIDKLMIKYNDTSFWHCQDDKVVKTEWQLIENAYINQRFISIKTLNSNYILPKSAMNQSEYDEFSKMILEKVKHVEIE